MTKTIARIGVLSAVLAATWTVPAFTQSANRSQPTVQVTQPTGPSTSSIDRAGARTAVPAVAQSANRSEPPTPIQPAQPSGRSTATASMVQQCRDHCRMVTARMDGLDGAVAEARRTNDPAAVRKALDAADKAAADARTQVDQCMRMMTS